MRISLGCRLSIQVLDRSQLCCLGVDSGGSGRGLCELAPGAAGFPNAGGGGAYAERPKPSANLAQSCKAVGIKAQEFKEPNVYLESGSRHCNGGGWHHCVSVWHLKPLLGLPMCKILHDSFCPACKKQCPLSHSVSMIFSSFRSRWMMGGMHSSCMWASTEARSMHQPRMSAVQRP